MQRIIGIALFFGLTFAAFGQNSERPKQPDLPGDLMIDYGFNFWSEQPDLLPTRTWGSNSFGIYYTQRLRFNDHIGFNPGFGFTFEKFAFDDDYTWIQNDNGTYSLDTLTGRTLNKNKLTATYVEIPVEFRIHPLGTVNGEGWFIGIGAVGGMRINAHTKVKYDIGDDTKKQKLYDDFRISDFRYGLQFRFGFKTVHLVYKTYLNDLFTDAPDASGKIPQVSTFGINFSGF